MKKLANKINIEKVLVFFLLLQPFIDLATSLMTRFFNSFVTIGILIKIVFLLILFVYVFIKYKYKQRKISTIFLVIFFIYEITYLIINSNSIISSIYELKSSIKAFFCPMVLVLLYDIFKNDKIQLHTRYMIYILLSYSILIFIANISGTAFNTYGYLKDGSVGWYYSGNDISALLASFFPLLYYFALKKNKLYLYILTLISVYVMFSLGTKVPVLGLSITLISFLILSIANYFLNKNKHTFKKNIFLIVLLSIFLLIQFPNSTFIGNIKLQYDNITKNNTTNKNTTKNNNNKKDNKKEKDTINQIIYSSRTEFLKNTNKRYIKSSIQNKIFGMGFLDAKNKQYKLVEMDEFDLFYNHGIFGTIIYIIPFMVLFMKLLKIVFKLKLKQLLNIKLESYVMSILLFLGISFYAGHVLLNPTVSMYLDVIILIMYFNIYCLTNKNNGKNPNIKKISFLALHLKPGGVEKFIVNTANFLSRSYDVEIICTYKYPKTKIFSVNNNIKVKYLLTDNLLPNKDEIKKSIKSRNIIVLIKELYVSFKIIILKRVKLIKYVKNCNSDVIISTRILHNEIVSEYCNDNITKIVTEHNYYTIKKRYSLNVVDSCVNIDYFVVSTNDQKKYYEKLFVGNKVKVVCIPFGLEIIPNTFSKLNTNKLISIGRFSKEKGFNDLIEIFNIISKKCKNIKLDIIGYGSEEANIRSEVKKFRLEKKVVLHIGKDKNYINNMLHNSSLYLMASHSESFGIVLIEAMSNGVPCIIFDSAKGALEIVSDNENGYIIKNRDKKEFANKVIYLLNNREILKKMGEKAKIKSKEYDIHNIEEKWLNLIKNY